jgi:uncharacterized protein YbaR (Trm112 family)
MLKPEFLEILRCPLDPSKSVLPDKNHLVCERCGLRFPIKDGIPVLLAEEAELPPGFESTSQLPCQREGIMKRMEERGSKTEGR